MSFIILSSGFLPPTVDPTSSVGAYLRNPVQPPTGCPIYSVGACQITGLYARAFPGPLRHRRSVATSVTRVSFERRGTNRAMVNRWTSCWNLGLSCTRECVAYVWCFFREIAGSFISGAPFFYFVTDRSSFCLSIFKGCSVKKC